MFSINQSPPIVSLSGSPLRFSIYSDRVAEFLRILAYPIQYNNDIADVLPLDQNNLTHFDLHEYYKGRRSSEYVRDNAFLHLNFCKPASIRFKEYFGNPPDVSATELIYDGHIIDGYIPRWKQNEFRALYSSFYDYLQMNKPYLTWYPRTIKKMLPEQPERLYFLNTGIAADLKIIVGVYFQDGTFVLHDPERSINTGQYQVISFATGYSALGLKTWAEANHPGKKITHYYVSVSRNGYGISEPFAYKVDYNDYRNVRYLVFQNSLSGWDTLACTGEYDQTIEIERSIASRIADVSDVNRLHKIEYHREYSQLVKVNTGWLTIGEKEWLTELLISDKVFELLKGQLTPVLIRTKQFDTTDRIFQPGEAEIEYERLFLAE